MAPASIARAKARGLVGPVLYGLAAILAFMLPQAAWALFIGIPLIYIFRRREAVES